MPAVKRIAFIGSVPTGWATQIAAAETSVKHVALELDGKNPVIIFPDVDLKPAANSVVGGMNFAWQGQSYGSTSRLLLQQSLYDEFIGKLKAKIEALRLGDPTGPASQMGLVNSGPQHQRMLRYSSSAMAMTPAFLQAASAHPGRTPPEATGSSPPCLPTSSPT